MRKNELLLRDTFQFLAGLGAVAITILADLNITPHLSLAVRSAIDVGGWADCAALVAGATIISPLRDAVCMQEWEQNRFGACESNQQTRAL